MFHKLLFFVLVERVLGSLGGAAESDDFFTAVLFLADTFGETETVDYRDDLFELDFGCGRERGING